MPHDLSTKRTPKHPIDSWPTLAVRGITKYVALVPDRLAHRPSNSTRRKLAGIKGLYLDIRRPTIRAEPHPRYTRWTNKPIYDNLFP